MNKKRRFSIFYTVYFSLLAIFAIALTVVSFKLSAFIKEYNMGIPETVSEKFFNETFINLDTDKIIQMSGIEPCEFETVDDIRAFLQKELSGDITYTSVSTSGSDESKKYIVKSGEYKLASFTLSPDKNGDYSPVSLELHLPKTYQKSYRIFSGSSLSVNGVAVSDDYITDREPYKYSDMLPEGVAKPEWITYHISGLTKEPVSSLTDRNGNTAELIETDGILCEELIYDTVEEDISERLLTAAKEYAKCMQNDASKGSIYPYFEKGTELYESIRTVQNTFVWDHSGYDFEDEEISEFMRYDENTVSLRISFTHILKMYGKEDYRDITDITYFARNIDGVYRIFARYNN